MTPAVSVRGAGLAPSSCACRESRLSAVTAVAFSVAGDRAHAGTLLDQLPWGHRQPIWEYDAKTLATDLSAHLAYGAGTGAAFSLLAKIL